MVEQGKENRIDMRPSLIIGLGGTGIKAATQIKMDILEINDQIPSQIRIIGFDTVEKNPVRLGGWGKERKPGKHATGPVMLSAGEYVYLGGNAREEARRVIDGKDDLCRERWWNVRDYLSSGVPENVWNLSEGAGQYRQFGRVALFNNIERVITMLDAALRAIQGSTHTSSVIIHIIGSLAGGTGAGQFIDMAYLARKVAHQAAIGQVTIMGYFALVNAFRGTPELNLGDNVKQRSFDARCFAALLELGRLQTAVDPEVQYPMCYNRLATADKVRNGRMEQKPFDAVYLFDGRRANTNLELIPIEWGVAPTIADVVVAQVDSVGGTDITQHTANIDAWRNAANIDSGVPLMGSVGAYSIVLPVYHWVEGWTHNLAQDLVDTLAPTDFNETGVPYRLARNRFEGKSGNLGSEDAQIRLGRAQGVFTEFLYYLWEIGRRSQDPNQETSLAAELNGLGTEAWLNKLTENVSNPSAKNRLERVLLTDLSKRQVRRGVPNDYWIDPDSGSTGEMKVQNVEQQVASALKRLVGEELSDGRREGGQVKETLSVFKRTQVERFSSILISTLEKLMNGESGQTAVVGRAGKLGYVQDMLEALRSHYQQTAIAMGGMEGVGKAKRTIKFAGLDVKVTTLNSTLSEMKNNPGSSRRRVEYIQNAEEVLNAHRLEICRRVAGETAAEVVGVLDNLIESFGTWGTRLALGSEGEGGIRAAIAQGASDNLASLEASCKVRTRNVLNDEDAQKYADDHYHVYLTRKTDQKELLLGLFKWEIKSLGENKLQLTCSLDGAPLRLDASGGPGNAERILELCRDVFDPAWEELSVMNYLVYKYRDDNAPLVEILRVSNGPLLAHKSKSSMPAKFLRVNEPARAKAEQDFMTPAFLDQVNSELKAEMNEGVNQIQGLDNQAVQKNFGISTSQDRFKLTYLFFEDAIQLHKTVYFPDAAQHYRDVQRHPGWLHIFAAEQSARRYADSLPRSLSEPVREFDYKVIHLLEDLNLFKLAARCLVYGELSYNWGKGTQGLLLHAAKTHLGQTEIQYRLTLIPSGVDTFKRGDQLYNAADESPVNPEHFALSELAGKPSLFDALQCFVYMGSDRRQPIRVFHEANYKRVHDTLQWAIARDLEARRPISGYQTDRMGWEPPKKGINPDQIQEVQLMVAQYRKNQAWLKNQKARLVANYHIGESHHGNELSVEEQRDADLQILLYLVVYEDNVQLRSQIDEYKGKLALDVVEDTPPVSEEITPPSSAEALPSISATTPIHATSGERVCRNNGCTQYNQPVSVKFCSECGQPTQDMVLIPGEGKNVCMNTECANHMKEVAGKFCPECGQPASMLQAPGKKVCLNEGCENYMQEVTSKFCPGCGNPPLMLQNTGAKVCLTNGCENYMQEITGKFCPGCGKPPSALQAAGRNVCLTEGCENYMQEVTGKFCPECGKPPASW